MENRHILLKNIDLKSKKELCVPSEFDYNTELGAWVAIANGTLLFYDPVFKAVASKKKDIEIGEDQK